MCKRHSMVSMIVRVSSFDLVDMGLSSKTPVGKPTVVHRKFNNKSTKFYKNTLYRNHS